MYVVLRLRVTGLSTFRATHLLIASGFDLPLFPWKDGMTLQHFHNVLPNYLNEN